MPPIKSDDDEHKKCLNDKIKSESALSKSKPLWISSNMKTTKSDESISKTELPKSSCANSKTTRCSLDKSVRDQYKSPARIEEEPETFTEIQSNQNNIRKVSRSPQNFKSNNTTAANPGAWQFWMINPKEPHPIKTPNENPISKIVAPKSTDDSAGKKPNKADTKTSSAKTPVHQNDLGAPNPKQAVTSKSSTPIKTNTSQTAPTSEAASDKTKPMPVPKQPLAQKPKQQNKPMGQIKPSEFLAKDVKSGKAEQINLKPIQQIGKADSNTLGSSGKATDFVGDKKIPPLKTDSQKPKAQNPILATLFKHFDGTTERGKANTMAGDSPVDESQLKGLSKYFNGQTNRGRANRQLKAHKKKRRNKFVIQSEDTIKNLEIMDLKNITNYVNTRIIRGRKNITDIRSYQNYFKSEDFKERVKLLDTKLEGITKQFSGNTLKGRANVAKATYATVAAGILFITLKSSM